MRLTYKAVGKDGKIAKGLVDATDVSEAVSYLRQRGLYPINITPKKNNVFLNLLPSRGKVKGKDIAFFTRLLSSMITSGLTLIKSLEILKEQTQSTGLVDIENEIINDVSEGSSFSKAISKYPEIFSSIYISLVKAGESSGLLDKILIRLADNLEKQQKLRSTIKSALMYPTIVVVMMAIVMGIMMLFVIPKLSILYVNLNVPLPLPTRILVGFASFVGTFWPIFIVGFVLIGYAFRRWKRSENGELIFDSYVLKIPLFGLLIKKTILAEFSRTLGLLIGTGTLVVDALLQTADITGNKLYENAIRDVSKRVEKGVTVGDALSAYSVFPQILIQLVKVGEQTGKLDETLVKASEYFETEVNQSVKALTTAMEPFIMVVLGIGVAFLIISVITPIYSLVSAIQ